MELVYKNYKYSRGYGGGREETLAGTLDRSAAFQTMLSVLNTDVLQQAKDEVVVVSSLVEKRFLRGGQYVLIADCDGERDAELAGTYFTDVKGYQYCKIQSSPNHYWLVVDFVGDINAVLAELKLVPGNDPNYYKGMERRKDLQYRVFTKTGIPPVFPTKHHLQNPLVCEWVKKLEEHFTCPDYEKLRNFMKLRREWEIHRTCPERTKAPSAPTPEPVVGQSYWG